MIKLTGTNLSRGLAIGEIQIVKHAASEISQKITEFPDIEKQRLNKAIEAVKLFLDEIQEKVAATSGQKDAAIFFIQKMILEEEELIELLDDLIINQHHTAEYALRLAELHYSAIFAGMGNEYMRARADDLKDVVNKCIMALSGENLEQVCTSAPKIIVTDVMTASDVVSINKNNVLGVVNSRGTEVSHASILAKNSGIPYIIRTNIDLALLKNGMICILNANNGEVLIEPDQETLDAAVREKENNDKNTSILENFKGLETSTIGGRKIRIYANIGNAIDLENAVANDAEGIGLFRTEFLFLGDSIPNEDEQFNIYRETAAAMKSKETIIRTFDIGADKKSPCLAKYLRSDEANPALGYRAIRVSLKETDLFKTQLRAILRASIYGNISIMYPMIISVEELLEAKKLVEASAEELKSKGIDYRIPLQGVMIETPAAVMIGDELAQQADFFSIGTNDLTQYTLAIDRLNQDVASSFNRHHPALLRMIRMAAQSAHKYGKRIGICGELGSDETLTEMFLDMEIDELSVSPTNILPLRAFIRKIVK